MTTHERNILIKEGMLAAARITSLWMLNNRIHPNVPNEQLAEAAKVAAHSALQQAALSIQFEAEKLD